MNSDFNSGNRLVLVLFAVMVVFLASMVYVSAIETKGGVVNGTFEFGTGSQIAGQTYNTYLVDQNYYWLCLRTNDATGSCTFDTTEKYSGNQSIKIIAKSTTTTGARGVGVFSSNSTIGGIYWDNTEQLNVIRVKPNTTYNLSACGKLGFNGDETNTVIGYGVVTSQSMTNEGGHITDFNPNRYLYFTETDWTCKSSSFTTGSTAYQLAIGIRLINNENVDKSVWFDDIRLEEVDTVSLSTQQSGRPSLTITGVTDTNAIDQSQTNIGDPNSIGFGTTLTNYISQSITPTQTKQTGITFILFKQGNPTDNLNITIQGESSDAPNGIVSARSPFPRSRFPTSAVEYYIPLPFISYLSTYTVKLERTGILDSENHNRLSRSNLNSSYSGGKLLYYNGSAWVELADAYFKTHFAKLSSSVDLNVVAPDGTSELKYFDVNGDILTDANITINPDGTGRYYYKPTFRNTYPGFKYDYFTDITSVNYGNGTGLTSNLGNGIALNTTIRNIDFTQKFVLPNNCTLNGLKLTPNVEIQSGRDMNIAYSSDGSTFSLWSDLNSDTSTTPLNTTALDGNNTFYLKFGAKTSTTYVRAYTVDANLSCPSLTTPLFKNGNNTVYTMNKDANNQNGATLNPSLMSNLTFNFTAPTTTFSSFQVPNTTDQNITLSCNAINAVSYTHLTLPTTYPV